MPAEFEKIVEYLLFLAINEATADNVCVELFLILEE
jgi:hypothetical protein